MPPAWPGEFAPLRLGALVVDPPILLAPMAGVTNAPFRVLCRRFSGDRGLYVGEMITARSLALGHPKTRRLASFDPHEKVRSTQLYGTDPNGLAEATRILVEDFGVHHIDLNFGCPVRKVTAAGGGAAIPARPRLMARLLRAVVSSAAGVPVTCKFRKGLDEDLLTYRDAGHVAQEEGCVAAALHARTAAQLYSGDADWDAIADLAARLRIPVLGNGDVFECFDALRMMRATGCAGVVVGRGCLGRPWLFGELVAVFAGREPEPPPALGRIVEIALEHARLLVDFFGERSAMLQMRKHVGWYLKSFPNVRARLPALHRVETLAELRERLAELPADAPFPAAALRARRAKGGRTQKVALPPGFLEDRLAETTPAQHLSDEIAGLDGG